MISLELQWEAVKEFYEKAYKVKFKKRLKDQHIKELYSKMILLSYELDDIPDHRKAKIFEIKSILKAI